MMVAVLVVITHHAPVVSPESLMVDESEVVADDPPTFVDPDLAAQLSIATSVRDFMNFEPFAKLHICISSGA
jgi:hypothetical protein